MLTIVQLRVNGCRCDGSARLAVTEDGEPSFSWSLASGQPADRQQAFCITVTAGEAVVYASGWVDGEAQTFLCPVELPREVALTVTLRVRGGDGTVSAPCAVPLFVSGLQPEEFSWITAQQPREHAVLAFSKEFTVTEPVDGVPLYVCGIGYHKVLLNGREVDTARLDPPYTDYTKTCQYVLYPDVSGYLHSGVNRLEVLVASGWRQNAGAYFNEAEWSRHLHFAGTLCLAVCLKLATQPLCTDDTWQVTDTKYVYSHLFNGETYDAGHEIALLGTAVPTAAPCERIRLMTLEPIVEKEVYRPRSIIPMGDRHFIVDFGQNLAGTVKLRLPALPRGGKVVLRHAEELDEIGELYRDTLRTAQATDTYIAAGDDRDLTVWQPTFLYHGFRYVSIDGLDYVSEDDTVAVALRTDLQPTGDFTCGSAILNQIHQTVVKTEQANMHGILTDCPQRDERMGWMNDATVRFNELPYNFDAARMFVKVVEDIIDSQGADGSITCTAPYVYGFRPGDPVCSSFLIAGLESIRFYGNTALVARAYPHFEAWQAYLHGIAVDGIVELSHYGDWAGPIAACVGGETSINAVRSRTVPGALMSTGYHYYNACLLEEFADLLGYEDKAAYYRQQKETIRAALLRRWWDADTATMAGGSQSAQAFALWLGILPEDKRAQAAGVLHEALVANDYTVTTGNLCTRYLLDALTEYGYVDDAYRILTDERYPSLGYMLQHEATTVWERFELKKEDAMNSHNHPMYGAVDYWFYAYLAGIKPTDTATKRVRIKPYFPTELKTVNCTLNTVQGKLAVRWNKQYNALNLYVHVPCGMTAQVEFNGQTETVTAGFHHFSMPIKTASGNYVKK